MFSNQLLTDLFLFIIGFVFLTGGAEFLVRGASRIAVRLNVSPIVIGLTIVAFGTSLPELLVSVVANAEPGGSDIALGNIIGSNIANLGLILGLAASMTVIHVERHLMRRELPLLIIMSVAFIALSWNGILGLVEGIILAAGLLAFTYYSYTATRLSPAQREEGEDALEVIEVIDEEIAKPSTHPLVDVAFIILGLMALIFGAEWLVTAAESLARALGISDLVIGLTLVAVGTSLPELATTLVAVRQREADIAVGNVVGSNLFNLLFIGGVSSLANPLSVAPSMFIIHYPVMVGITVLAYLMALPKPHVLTRWKGWVLLAVYSAYTIYQFLGQAT